MSIVSGVMQVLGFEAQEPTHPLELALIREALSLEGTEQFTGVEDEYALSWDCLWQDGVEPAYWCLDGFRREIAGGGK